MQESKTIYKIHAVRWHGKIVGTITQIDDKFFVPIKGGVIIYHSPGVKITRMEKYYEERGYFEIPSASDNTRPERGAIGKGRIVRASSK